MTGPINNDDAVHTTKTSFTIGDLNAGTSYQVQVRAVNDEGEGPWSILGTGKTNTANREPEFGDEMLTREVDENTRSNTGTGQNVGARVSANQRDNDKLTYSLAPAVDENGAIVGATESHPDLFTIDKSTGQIRTGELLSHEDPACGYDDREDPTMCTYTVGWRSGTA